MGEKVICQRCGCDVRSFSPMRKWCVDCRRVISLEQARARKYGLPSPAFDLRVADVRNDPRKLQ